MAKQVNFEVGYIDKGNAKQKLTDLDRAVDNLAKTTDSKLVPSTQRSTMQLLSLSQIVQDAPYGIRGVGNNIEFLTQQFVQGSAQGYKFSAMLKGMLTSLWGPSGILFAISAVTSAITYFSLTSSQSKTAVDKQTDALQKQREELDRLKHSYDKLSMSSLILTQVQLQEQLTKLTPQAINKNLPGGETYFAGFTKLTDEQIKQRTEILKQLDAVKDRIESIGILESKRNELEEYRDRLLKSRSPAEIEYLQNKIKELEATKQINVHLEKQKDTLGILTVAYGNYVEVLSQAIAQSVAGGSSAGGISNLPGMNNVHVPRKPKLDFKDLNKEFNDKFINTSAMVMRNEFGKVWEDVFGHANSLFEKLVQSWADLFFDKLSKGLFEKYATPFLSGLPIIGPFFASARITTASNVLAERYKVGE